MVSINSFYLLIKSLISLESNYVTLLKTMSGKRDKKFFVVFGCTATRLIILTQQTALTSTVLYCSFKCFMYVCIAFAVLYCSFKCYMYVCMYCFCITSIIFLMFSMYVLLLYCFCYFFLRFPAYLVTFHKVGYKKYVYINATKTMSCLQHYGFHE